MTRGQLEHIIRVAAGLADSNEIMIVRSQSVLGAFPDAPAELLQSMEAGVYPLHAPALADVIDGSIGEGSPFERTYGYYAQGVGPETAKLPAGWEGRVVRIQSPATDGKVGWCPEAHDLAASKLAAGREKDKAFVSAMLRFGLVQAGTLAERIAGLPVDAALRERIQLWLQAEAARSTPSGPGR